MTTYMSESHWMSGGLLVQMVDRKGVDILYIAGVGNVSATFYEAEEMSMWLLDQGVNIEDPVWDYIEALPSANC